MSIKNAACGALSLVTMGIFGQADATTEKEFYLPEGPTYTIVDSMRDSIQFTVERTLTEYKGYFCSKSSFVDMNGEIMHWHDFGDLEGPGWAANAVGGAYEIYKYSKFIKDSKLQNTAISILHHVLENGFVDEETGFITGYRDTQKDQFCLNFKHNNEWFCPGSMAKIAYQLLIFSNLIDIRRLQKRMRKISVRTARWIHDNLKLADNGWYPRRITPEGEHYYKTAEGGRRDPLFDGSADGLFIVQLMTELSLRGLGDWQEEISERLKVFIDNNGIYGSINHDTYDAHENIAYSVAFRTLRSVAKLFDDNSIREFAYERCLAELDKYKMKEDRNGVQTKGLLFMEPSWDTAYLWENAEAALAYFEAYADTHNKSYLNDGLTILRAAAKHHHGDCGFLTEGVDWNNHVGREHHFDEAEFGDIKYTEPFLNNQHITEPTLYYLQNLLR